MKSWIDEVILKWKSEGIKLNPPATFEDIEKAESILNFKFPEDFKRFYLAVNAFEDYEWQKHMFSFWSLQRIIDEFDETEDSDFIGFCDFWLCSYFIGFTRNKIGVFKNYKNFQTGEFELVAPTFEEAIDMINRSADSIY